ncbi:MAG: WG repeat-containing protein [Bacteroidota bacterium]
MRILIPLCFVVNIFLLQAQPLTDGMIFNQADSSYYFRYDQEKFTFYNRDSTAIFGQQFDEFPAQLNYGFYKGQYQGKHFVFSPHRKYMIQLNPKYDGLYDFQTIDVASSALSHDTLIRLKEFMYLNLAGELVFTPASYSEQQTKNKTYVLKTETDLLAEENYFAELKEEEYDEYSREQKKILELKNNFLLHAEYESLENSYDNEFTSSGYMPEQYYVIKQNKKVGVISSIGKSIIPLAYDYIEFMESEFFDLETDYIIIKAYQGSTCHVYNKSGKKLFESKYLQFESSYINPNDLGYENYFNGMETRKGKKVGVIHLTGHEIIPPVYDWYDYFDLDRVDYMKFDPDMSKKSECGRYPYRQYFLGHDNKTNTSTFYTPGGQQLSKIQMDYIDSYNRNGYFVFESKGLYGLAQPGACILKPAEYDYIDLFKGKKDLFIVSTAEHSSFIDGKGERLFGQDFAMAYFVDTSFAIVLVDGKAGLMNVELSGQTIAWQIEPQYDLMDANGVYIMNNNTRSFIVSKNKKFGIVDSRNTVLTPIEYDEIKTYGSIFTTVRNRKKGLLNSEAGVLLENNYDSLMMLNYSGNWFAKKGNYWGFLNVNHAKGRQEITAFEFDDIRREDQSHCYVVQKNGKWGVLSSDFKWVVEPKYISIKYDEISKEFECLKEDKQRDCYFVK